MVQSTAETVDGFLAEVGPERLDYIVRFRALCLGTLTGWEEVMAYGMPGYGPAGQPPVVCFNNQKQHIAFYTGARAIERFQDRLAGPGIDCGKGCIRYRNPKRIDFDLVEDILKAIREDGPKGACA